MFKIRTGQTNLPMSLCVSPGSHQLPLLAPSDPSQQTAAAPKLLPAPVLQHTAYSARTTGPPQITSSPPTPPVASPKEQMQVEQNTSGEVFRTPALPKHNQKAVVGCQLSSPPDSQQRANDNRLDQDKELTSSVVRGNAARDLLGLMQSR